MSVNVNQTIPQKHKITSGTGDSANFLACCIFFKILKLKNHNKKTFQRYKLVVIYTASKVHDINFCSYAEWVCTQHGVLQSGYPSS